MKFKITSTENKWFQMDRNNEHAKRMYQEYPEIKNKTKIINDKGELEIEICTVEEIVKLANLCYKGIVIYKDESLVNGRYIDDEVYTIEFYDDYRE